MTSSPSNSDKTTYTRHEKCHPNGGIHLKDDPNSTVSVRSVILNLIKSFGSKLKEGKVFDLLKVSRPACISYPRTYLECVAHDLIYTNLLDKAASCQDPVQRMKYLVAFFVAGLHRNACEMGNNGPLNPVLGETFMAEKTDGTKLYCEQISHHPPVSAYYMVDAAGNYQLYGTGEVSAKLSGMNHIEGKRIGQTTIIFKDGSKVTIANPEMMIEGVMMGDRIINHLKSFCFVDAANNITAEIKFNYSAVGTVAKLTSGFKNLFGRSSKTQEEKVLNDTLSLEIFSTEDQERKVLASGFGSWLSFVEIDGETLWQVTDPVQNNWSEECKGRLESDSTNRLDSQFIRIKDFNKAQKEKDLIENNQRLDAKIRKAADKKHKAHSDKSSGKAEV
jgi:hypothetical protein